jgi:ABC-type polysaccharide/polyol phosphate export permease
MQNTLALDIPQSSDSLSRHRIARIDIIAGVKAVNIWGRLGWRDTKRRYRRTVFGPFWTTLSLALFIITLGLVWSNLWNQNPKVYLPYLTSGMVCWVFFSTICTEGCGAFWPQERLIKQLRISYTLLACVTVWRNVTVFFHNILMYVAVFIYAGLPLTWSTLLFIPGFLLLCINAAWITALLGTFCARYRDMQQLVGSLLQISLFLTPIFWSADQLKGRMQTFIEFNPLYHLIAIVRDPLLGRPPELLHWVVAATLALIGWIVVLQLLTRVRHRIVYWI